MKNFWVAFARLMDRIRAFLQDLYGSPPAGL